MARPGVLGEAGTAEPRTAAERRREAAAAPKGRGTGTYRVIPLGAPYMPSPASHCDSAQPRPALLAAQSLLRSKSSPLPARCGQQRPARSAARTFTERSRNPRLTPGRAFAALAAHPCAGVRRRENTLSVFATILPGAELDSGAKRRWPRSAKRGGASPRGEAETGKHPVDVCPAERARHGWRALAFARSKDCEVQKGASTTPAHPLGSPKTKEDPFWGPLWFHVMR